VTAGAARIDQLVNSAHRVDAAVLIEKAKAFGASLAGIAGVDSLRESASLAVVGRIPPDVKSVLVLALAHRASEPELDWWDGRPGHTRGNHRLMNAAGALGQWLNEEFHVQARLLPYAVEKGGVFLKDAGVLAGLGVIGKNNLLITREFGPRVRLRALALDVELEHSGATDFAPCATCSMPCWQACPQRAFADGAYHRASCHRQMEEDAARDFAVAKSQPSQSRTVCVKYCRACEMACPVGRQPGLVAE